MKKTKIFMGIGTLVLGCAAFLAAKPAKTLSAATTAFTKSSNGILATVAVVSLSGNHFTTAAANGVSAFFATVAAKATLFTSIGGAASQSYYK